MSNMKNNSEGGALIHLHDFYDVSYHGGSQYENNCLLKLRNALLSAFTTKDKIPHTIIIMFGDGTFTRDFMMIEDGNEKMLNWIFTEVTRMVFHRKQQLPNRAIPSFNTRLMTVGLLPVSNERKQLKRGKFNTALINVAAAKGVKFIFSNAVLPTDHSSFDMRGNITGAGLAKYWKEISEAVNIIDSKGYNSYKQLIQIALKETTTHRDDVVLPYPYNYEDHSLIITSAMGNDGRVRARNVQPVINQQRVRQQFHRINDQLDDVEGNFSPWYQRPITSSQIQQSTAAQSGIPPQIDATEFQHNFGYRGGRRGNSHNGRGYWRRKRTQWMKNKFNNF